MNELIKINYESEQPTVSARDLHEALEIRERFSLWFSRLMDTFTLGEDFTTVGKPTLVNNGAERLLDDYNVSVDMAKHVSMMCKTEKGKEYRQYFIDLEKAWNTPEQVMARALQVANRTIENFNNQIIEMKPKAEYFDELVDRNLLTNFRDTAKELGIKEKDFINFLQVHGYVYRDQKSKLKPYADKNNGLFEIKEFTSIYSSHAGVQTLITPKGRETFRLLIQMDK